VVTVEFALVAVVVTFSVIPASLWIWVSLAGASSPRLRLPRRLTIASAAIANYLGHIGAKKPQVKMRSSAMFDAVEDCKTYLWSR